MICDGHTDAQTDRKMHGENQYISHPNRGRGETLKKEGQDGPGSLT